MISAEAQNYLVGKETHMPGIKKERDGVKANDKGETDWHWLRSANRGSACYTWNVNSSGYVSNGHGATYSLRFAPVCVIGATAIE
jgi:hypothetical protein